MLFLESLSLFVIQVQKMRVWHQFRQVISLAGRWGGWDWKGWAGLGVIVAILGIVGGTFATNNSGKSHLSQPGSSPTPLTTSTIVPFTEVHSLNIAVAEFGEITNDGIESSAVARQVSKLLFDSLDSTYQAITFEREIQVAHKNIGLILEDREAEELAENIGAHLVIYGTMFVDDNQASLTPRFYVSEQPDAGELTGIHQLGLPIRFDISSPDFPSVREDLISRAAIVTQFTIGLLYHADNNLDAATNSFQQVIHELEGREEAGLAPFNGQEIIYLFAGVMHRLQGEFEIAEDYLNHAIALSPNYTRAHIARGNIYYTDALPNWDRRKLNDALDAYHSAAESANPRVGTYVNNLINTSLGNAYVVLAQQANAPELFNTAIQQYSLVVDEYEDMDNEARKKTIRGLAATAYFGLGVAYERQGNDVKAKDAYARCVTLAEQGNLGHQLSELKPRCNRISKLPSTILTVEAPPAIIPIPSTTVTATPRPTLTLTNTATHTATPVAPPAIIPIPSTTVTATPRPTLTLTNTATHTATPVAPPAIIPIPSTTVTATSTPTPTLPPNVTPTATLTRRPLPD